MLAMRDTSPRGAIDAVARRHSERVPSDSWGWARPRIRIRRDPRGRGDRRTKSLWAVSTDVTICHHRLPRMERQAMRALAATLACRVPMTRTRAMWQAFPLSTHPGMRSACASVRLPSARAPPAMRQQSRGDVSQL